MISILFLMSIDFVTKILAASFLNLNPQNNLVFVKPFISDFYFALAHNYNSNEDFKNPFKLPDTIRYIAFSLSIAISFFILIKKPLSKILKYGIILYISGLSNLIEFLIRGYATDFLMPNPLMFSNNIILIFNIADVFIFFGTVLVFIGLAHEYFLNKKRKNLTSSLTMI